MRVFYIKTRPAPGDEPPICSTGYAEHVEVVGDQIVAHNCQTVRANYGPSGELRAAVIRLGRLRFPRALASAVPAPSWFVRELPEENPTGPGSPNRRPS